MPDANGKLEHRTAQAFARMNNRVKALEATGIPKQQLEDLTKLAPEVASLLKRVSRIENTLVHHRDMRENSIENDFIVASEMVLIRDRVLTLEGKLACVQQQNESTARPADPTASAPTTDGGEPPSTAGC